MVKQPRLRAVKDWGIEPLDIDDLDNMINEWCGRINTEAASYTEVLNDGREGNTWAVDFVIIDLDASYKTFILTFFQTLFQGVDKYRKGIASIALLSDPEIYFTPQNMGSHGYEIEMKFTMSAFGKIPTKLSEIVDEGFILTVTDGVGIDYCIDIYFA